MMIPIHIPVPVSDSMFNWECCSPAIIFHHSHDNLGDVVDIQYRVDRIVDAIGKME